MAERRALDPKVEGSSPSSPAKIIIVTLAPCFLDQLPAVSIGVLEKEFGRFKTKWICQLPFTAAMLAEGLTAGDLFTSGYFHFD